MITTTYHPLENEDTTLNLDSSEKVEKNPLILDLEGLQPILENPIEKNLDDCYQIYCNKKQAGVIQNALELWARISGGQIQELLRPYNISNTDLVDEIRRLSRQIEVGIKLESLTGKDKDLAWEMYQTVRHRLSWDKAGNPIVRDWNTMWSVNYDEPMKITTEPLLSIAKL
jgi:hypothetical protein